MVRKSVWTSAFLKYYLDKTQSREVNGFHPPMVVSFVDMENFIRITRITNEHVMVVTPAMCHFKNGDMVKVTEGDFKGVVGKVARVAGQQRVIVELCGLCMVATAYIPSAFIELLENK